MKPLLLSLLFSIVLNVSAQSFIPDVIVASGDVFENNDISLSWTIGENIIESFSETDLIILNGFYEFDFSDERYNTLDENNFEIEVFPTITQDIIQIHFSNAFTLGFTACIYDLTGKKVDEEEIVLEQTQIDLSMLAPGFYFLSIFDNENSLQYNIKLLKEE